MKDWQHDETGRITSAPESPGPRWQEVPYAAAMATPADIERLQQEAYAEGRKDEREEIVRLCDETVEEMRGKDLPGDSLAGVEALADTLRGIDSATGLPSKSVGKCGRCGGVGECAQQADNHAPGCMYLDNCPDCKGTGLNCQRAYALLGEAAELLATYMRWVTAHPGKSAPADLLTRMANLLSELA